VKANAGVETEIGEGRWDKVQKRCVALVPEVVAARQCVEGWSSRVAGVVEWLVWVAGLIFDAQLTSPDFPRFSRGAARCSVMQRDAA